jgi:RND superfamily putative drug exporter
VSIPATFLAVYGLTGITSVFFIVQYLVALLGLGLAIDYSLLLVTRWREELAAGYDRTEAVHRAMATAGRSVAFSGLTVAAGMLVLIVVPVPLVRSIGLGGMLIPAAGFTLTEKDGRTLSLSSLRGKVVVLDQTASARGQIMPYAP